MTIFFLQMQVLSGRLPYYYLKSEAHILMELHNGNQPQRPDEPCIADTHWHFIQQCWTSPDEARRPRIEDICQFVQEQYEMSCELQDRSVILS